MQILRFNLLQKQCKNYPKFTDRPKGDGRTIASWIRHWF